MSLSSARAGAPPGVRSPTAQTVFGSPTLRRIRRTVTPYLFIAPFFALLIIFLVYPLGFSFDLSLYRTRLIGGTKFIGLQNYVTVLHDPYFWEGVRNMLLFGCVQVPLMLGLALLFALLLDSGVPRLRRLFRLGYFLPFAIPGVVAALMWGYLYGQSFGPLAQIARATHLFTAPNFLTASSILPSIGNIVIWQYTGYNMIIMYAALQSIPPQLYEAARIDGAHDWQIAIFVKVPMILQAIVFTGIFSIIGTLQLFVEPQILQGIAPSAVNGHITPNIYAYNITFANQQLDYAAAVSFTLGVVIAVLSALFFFVFNWRRAR
jgi:multiple sugar transport system permease protein